METNKDSTHQSQNEDNFATLSLRLEFLKEAEKEKNNKRRLGAVMIRFTEQSLLILFFLCVCVSDLMHNSPAML